MIRSARFVSVLILLAGTLYFAPPASAAVPAGTDVLGLATAADATGEFRLIDPVPGGFDLHLLVYGYEHAQGIVGWECALQLPAEVELVSVSAEGKPDPIVPNPGDPSLRVFPLQPLMPIDGIVRLATLHLNLVSFESTLEIGLLPHSSPQLAGAMSFALESSAANDQVLAWPGDCPVCPVFDLVPSSQPTAEFTWEEVKSLYR